MLGFLLFMFIAITAVGGVSLLGYVVINRLAIVDKLEEIYIDTKKRIRKDY